MCFFFFNCYLQSCADTCNCYCSCLLQAQINGFKAVVALGTNNIINRGLLVPHVPALLIAAMKLHKDNINMQVQGCRSIATFCSEEPSTAHKSEMQSAFANGNGLEVIATAFLKLKASSSVVNTNHALCAMQQFCSDHGANTAAICQRADVFEAVYAFIKTNSSKEQDLASCFGFLSVLPDGALRLLEYLCISGTEWRLCEAVVKSVIIRLRTAPADCVTALRRHLDDVDYMYVVCACVYVCMRVCMCVFTT